MAMQDNRVIQADRADMANVSIRNALGRKWLLMHSKNAGMIFGNNIIHFNGCPLGQYGPFLNPICQSTTFQYPPPPQYAAPFYDTAAPPNTFATNPLTFDSQNGFASPQYGVAAPQNDSNFGNGMYQGFQMPLIGPPQSKFGINMDITNVNYFNIDTSNQGYQSGAFQMNQELFHVSENLTAMPQHLTNMQTELTYMDPELTAMQHELTGMQQDLITMPEGVTSPAMTMTQDWQQAQKDVEFKSWSVETEQYDLMVSSNL
jgi:hypothetical protein